MPANSNDAPASRPVVFQARSTAERYAIKCAMAFSRENLATPVEFVEGAFTPKGGGRCFAIEPAPMGEWSVVELSAVEVTRRQQAGIRYAIALLQEKAREETRAALAAKTPTFVRVHAKWAREARIEVRELELRLQVSGVRFAAGESQKAVAL